jgi:GNAT superfamily N-acetyltransferase
VDILDRMVASMCEAWKPIGEWNERDGIGAVVTRSAPQRSVVNSVIYGRDADIAVAYDWLESLYADVNAWTVWVLPDDQATAQFLERCGHVLDADPAAMVLDLATFEPPAELPEWQRGTIEQTARINEVAYPFHDGTMERALRESRYGDNLHLYATEDASVLGILDHDGDASVIFVATLPEARGRGLAGGLLAAALVEARERGNDISTLQATKLGEPVYARLGYESLGAMQMWEKRSA